MKGGIKLNNKNGFILYDALVSFILLSSIILFINKMILINNEFEAKVTQDYDAINYLRENIYNENESNTKDDMQFKNKSNEVCVIYEREICVKK